MGRVRTVDGTPFVFSECITCGISYCVPERQWDHQLLKGGFHHCPNGHSQGWTKENSTEEKLRLERDRLKQQLAQRDDEIRAERLRAEKAEAATKRLKKRTAAGTCPCCQRSFSNMSTHMRKQHPDFVKDASANVVPLKKARA